MILNIDLMLIMQRFIAWKSRCLSLYNSKRELKKVLAKKESFIVIALIEKIDLQILYNDLIFIYLIIY